jgi:hypothetical protein
MKKIIFRPHLENDKASPKDILTQVVSFSPAKPISIEEMRRRVKVLEGLEAMGPNDTELILEDGDHKILKDALENFPWNAANRTLLNVIDDVLDAKPPLKVVDKAEEDPPRNDKQRRDKASDR